MKRKTKKQNEAKAKADSKRLYAKLAQRLIDTRDEGENRKLKKRLARMTFES